MENENVVEPVVTELGLALGYSSGRRIERSSSSSGNDLGAGANAASRIDLTYVATDPLSEIVWSPNEGLCLKCTQCSFSKNKHSLVWGAGPSHPVCSLQQTNTSARSSNEKPMEEHHICKSFSVFPDLNTKVSDIDNSDKSAADNDDIRSCHELQTDHDYSFQGRAGSVNLVEKNDPIDSESNQVAEVHTDNERGAFETPEKNVKSTAQNDLQGLSDDECVATRRKLSGSESAMKAEKNSWDRKEIPSEKMSGDKHSPTSSGIRGQRRKGKERALSDGHVKGMMSKSEDDDSHESVESCNSAALFSAGKKRWGFEHQLIVGSKRVKKQIDENPCSSSFGKQDSSFMNWISNMMKGFLKSNDQIPSLALTTDANANQSHENPVENLDLERGSIGFQSIFHSIYSPKTKVQGTPQNENDRAELELTNKIRDTNATPIPCHGENFNFLNVFNEKFRKPICHGGVDPPSRPKNSSMTLSPSKRSSEGNIAENTNLCNFAVDVEKDRASASSSLGKRKMNTENINSDPPSEAKMGRNISHKSNLLGNLWMTRFTPKASSMKLTPSSENNANFSNNLVIVETGQQCPEEPRTSSSKEILCGTEMEASIGFPSLRPKDSEAMASIFARRLDALKHIMPPGVSDNRTSLSVTCFFCGRKGHHLQYCPEITDDEIEHLLRNMKSSKRFEKLPCVCVRCFELDHWAVTCPTASIGQSHTGRRTSSLASFGELQCYAKFEENTKLSDDGQEAIAERTIRIDTGKGPITLYEVIAEKMKSNTNVNEKYVISGSKEIKPWGNFINRQVSETPKAIFDSVRMLRLSRTDILKLKNSQTSVSLLKGFFLRLRLTKWEKSGGTGYYVACITEATKQGMQHNPERSIAVNVGGIGCLVESQYISNHDFLEDELTAWLQTTKKSGGKIPSEEELTVKVKERTMLGL